MEMALSHPPSSLPLPKSPLSTRKHHSLQAATPISSRNPASINTFRCLAQVAVHPNTAAELESRKHDLLRAAQDTQRGLVATSDQRAAIEEALVCVEGYDAGSAIDLTKLDGTWRLHYTSASDVLVLLESAKRFPFFFQVGQIFQKFECQDQADGGIVRNVVRWSIPTLLEEQEGATLLVTAKFSVVSKRNIYLQFEELSLTMHYLNNQMTPLEGDVHRVLNFLKVAVENIKISEELQAIIAPALLPRSFLSLQILQFLKTFRAQVPVESPERRSPGGLYYLSYLDRDMLLGRAVGGGGIFVFTRAQALQ